MSLVSLDGGHGVFGLSLVSLCMVAMVSLFSLNIGGGLWSLSGRWPWCLWSLSGWCLWSLLTVAVVSGLSLDSGHDGCLLISHSSLDLDWYIAVSHFSFDINYILIIEHSLWPQDLLKLHH